MAVAATLIAQRVTTAVTALKCDAKSSAPVCNVPYLTRPYDPVPRVRPAIKCLLNLESARANVMPMTAEGQPKGAT